MKLIGGQKLRELGSDRHTDDRDYLIYDESNPELFIHEADYDIINAAAHPFYSAVWALDADSDDVSLQALFEMTIFTFVNHCENGSWEKADAKEYDIRFLARKMNGQVSFDIARNYISAGAVEEVEKILDSIRY
jgi:hypothetical protein